MAECEVITWIDPAGAETILTQMSDRDLEEGMEGRGMPPIRISDEIVPLQPGARLRSIEHDVREVSVPVVFFAPTLEQVRANLRGMMRKIDPKRGDGRLRVLTPDGVHRELVCRYSAGFEIVEVSGERGLSPEQAAQRGVFVFRAFDPYWYDVEPYVQQYAVIGGETFLPIPNGTTGSFVTLVESEVFTTGDIVLDTDVDAQSWPVWTITGPGSDVSITNDTTGETIDLSAAGGLVLGDREQAIIDTRPRRKTLLDGLGNNLMPYLTSASSLWPLSPEQTVTISVSGASTDTLLELSVAVAHLSV